MRSHTGLLIVFEGINGAGKTTVINEVVKYYKMLKMPVVVYKFPNRNGELGDKIDKYLTNQISIKSKYEVLDMFSADRKSVQSNIRRDLNEGKIVLCDRYVYSAIAYHIPSSVVSQTKIRLYCNVIGYFDKDMPIPDMIYLIEGEHLSKRGILRREVFHYHGAKSKQMHVKLHSVIKSYTSQYSVLKNKNNHVDDVVSYVVNDISLRW